MKKKEIIVATPVAIFGGGRIARFDDAGQVTHEGPVGECGKKHVAKTGRRSHPWTCSKPFGHDGRCGRAVSR